MGIYKYLGGILGFIFAGAVLCAVGVGDSLESVQKELGVPQSRINHGTTEILFYPGSARVTTKDGFVTQIEPLAISEPKPSERPTESHPEAQTTSKPAARQAGASISGESTRANHRELHKKPKSSTTKGPEEAAVTLVNFIGTLVLIAIALRISCRFWHLEMFFSGYAAVVLIHAGFQVLIAIGLYALGLEKNVAIDLFGGCLSILVMQMAIRRFSFNKDSMSAFWAASLTHVLAQIAWWFLFLFLLRSCLAI